MKQRYLRFQATQTNKEFHKDYQISSFFKEKTLNNGLIFIEINLVRQ